MFFSNGNCSQSSFNIAFHTENSFFSLQTLNLNIRSPYTLKLSLHFFFLISWLPICAQYSIEGFAVSDTTYTWFDKQVGVESNDLFLGVYENFIIGGDASIPYLTNDISKIHVQTGSLRYREADYEDVRMLYDLYNDNLLIRNHVNPNYSDMLMKPNQDQIEWFKIELSLIHI